MPRPTTLEVFQANQLLLHLEQTEPDLTLFAETRNPAVPEPPNLPPFLQAHLNVLANPMSARSARLAALRAIFRTKNGQE